MRQNEDVIALYSRKSNLQGKARVLAIRLNLAKSMFVCILVMPL